MTEKYDIFLVGTPGLEPFLLDEVKEKGFSKPNLISGGVTIEGTFEDVVRANRELRGATRVLLRIAEFRAMHLAQLDKRARKVEWAKFLKPEVPIHVEATCRKSKIYHDRAAAQRIGRAINETLGAPLDQKAAVRIKARIEDDLCTISIDTSGDALHKRGHKTNMGKAPMRETLAYLCLRACGYTGQTPLVDPMCGSGTFVVEAAEMAKTLTAGRDRAFAFQHLAFDIPGPPNATIEHDQIPRMFFGFDRDAGAISMSNKNATSAGVADLTKFTCQPIAALTPPDGPAGLVIVNPPYGGRIGNRKQLFGLYGSLGQVLQTNFKGWRVGLVTSDGGLAKATNLPWTTPLHFPNGGIKVALYQTDPL